jgi:hypothetical protein
MELTDHYPDTKEIAELSVRLKSRFLEELSKIDDQIESNYDFIIYKHNTDFNSLSKDGRRSIESTVLDDYIRKNNKFSLKIGENTLQWAENGKPSLTKSDVNISISHSKSILLMILGNNTQGCDIEKIENREPEEWKNLFDFRYTDTINHLLSTGIDSDMNSCCTRLWGVRETCMKAHAFVPLSITIENEQGNTIIFKVTHNQNLYHILTFPLDFLPNNKYIVTFLIHQKINDSERFNKEIVNSDNIYNPESKTFSTQFFTTFKDCRSFYAQCFSRWNQG